ncbi:MAG: NAD+ synthase [Verrucomicrobiae bacterium]|nr:NAD+ synthase [Verrucomicrobiae bacterium]
MKIALAQINTTVGDFQGNIARILNFYRQASDARADLVLFPELAICGYPPRDLLLRPQFVLGNLRALEKAASHMTGPPAIVGFVDRCDSPAGQPLRNAAAIIEKGRVTGRIHKMLLPTYDVFDETRYFSPADANEPIVLCGKRIGVTICEDIWNDEDFWPSRLYRRDPVRELKNKGIDLLANISSSPWHLGKEITRRHMMETVARNDQFPIAYCNSVGGNDELIFDGNSMMIQKGGALTARGRSFEEDLMVVDLELPASPLATEASSPSAENLFRALTLGVRDYTAKCGFRSVLLGLSGGIDSALTACLAAAALGRENVMGVTMPSTYSSRGSVEDSRLLAEALGIRFENVTIQPMVESFRAGLSGLFAGRQEDTTEENLQSRVRGVILMAISNKFGSLLLTTGNKSEVATGYCTLYGDMCGGLAVISDLSKTQVYDLARWINAHPEKTGLAKNVIPSDSLTKAPSAELRPNQTDQDTLPPYNTLDQIMASYVERHESISQMEEKGFDAGLLRDLIRKFDLSEYKRRQAAPGLKVTTKAFGVGRRFPIAQRYRET